MKYKPTESDLISYLYGELSQSEMEKVEKYLLENPDAKNAFMKQADVRKILQEVEEKEVIAPPILLERNSQVVFWKTTSFKTVLSIAASFMLLVVFARLMDLRILSSGNELRIGFGDNQTESVLVSPVTKTEVQQLIDASLVKNNGQLTSQWSNDRDALNKSIQSNLDQNSKKIDGLILNTSTASQTEIQKFVSGMQDQNLKLMKDYLQLSAEDQKSYIETLLVDFSKYLQEQRNQDLMYLQTRLNSIENNTDLFKQETEQILSSIITNVSSSERVN
ncbi:MAG: hypothetical protein HC811_12270 [Flammeovirgaceae bacterium]|nr:hypothetical protein [Flammeovirgaceae bacterium]